MVQVDLACVPCWSGPRRARPVAGWFVVDWDFFFPGTFRPPGSLPPPALDVFLFRPYSFPLPRRTPRVPGRFPEAEGAGQLVGIDLVRFTPPRFRFRPGRGFFFCRFFFPPALTPTVLSIFNFIFSSPSLRRPSLLVNFRPPLGVCVFVPFLYLSNRFVRVPYQLSLCGGRSVVCHPPSLVRARAGSGLYCGRLVAFGLGHRRGRALPVRFLDGRSSGDGE